MDLAGGRVRPDAEPRSTPTLARSRRREPAEIGAEHLDRALFDLEAHHSHFDRRDLLSSLANQLPEGADARALEAAVDSLIAGERLTEIHRGAGPLDSTYYTTPRLWQMEQRFMDDRPQGREGRCRCGRRRHPRRRPRPPPLPERRAGRDGHAASPPAASGSSPSPPVPGPARRPRSPPRRRPGRRPAIRGIGVATARSASGELSDAGVPATSITALLIQTEELASRGIDPLPRGTVIVVDESSTTSTPHAAALAELAEGCEGKLVMIGDPRQIGAVGPGGLYGHLTNEVEPIVLRRDPPPARSARSPRSSSSPTEAAAQTRSTCCAPRSAW